MSLEIGINDKSRIPGSHFASMKRKWSKMRTNIRRVRRQSQCYTYKIENAQHFNSYRLILDLEMHELAFEKLL